MSGQRHTWYFTFGFDHKDPVTGESRSDRYIEITAHTAEAAREAMFEHFGVRWAFQYPDKQSAGIDRWGLTCAMHIDAEEDDNE